MEGGGREGEGRGEGGGGGLRGEGGGREERKEVQARWPQYEQLLTCIHLHLRWVD